MTKIQTTVRSRPWLPPIIAAAAMLLMLLIPVSYRMTTGYSVLLRLSRTDLSHDDLGRLAAELGKDLGVEHVALSMSAAGSPELLARVPSTERQAVQRAAQGFAAALTVRGIGSELELQPAYAIVSGNLYAAGLGRISRLDIRRQGRSASEVENDIRSQLLASGVPDASVRYAEHGSCALVQIVVAGGANGSPGTRGDGVEVSLICSGSGAECKTRCSPECKAAAGTCAMKSDLPVTLDGQAAGFVCTAEAALASTVGLSDAAIAGALQDQFKAKGFKAEVVVREGRVVAVNPICAAAGSN